MLVSSTSDFWWYSNTSIRCTKIKVFFLANYFWACRNNFSGESYPKCNSSVGYKQDLLWGAILLLMWRKRVRTNGSYLYQCPVLRLRIPSRIKLHTLWIRVKSVFRYLIKIDKASSFSRRFFASEFFFALRWEIGFKKKCALTNLHFSFFFCLEGGVAPSFRPGHPTHLPFVLLTLPPLLLEAPAPEDVGKLTQGAQFRKQMVVHSRVFSLFFCKLPTKVNGLWCAL